MYAREVDRRRDRVASAEVEALAALALYGSRSPEFADELGQFEQISANLTAAIAARDDYIADGRPLPCPTS